jgi:hypothetical protein
MPVGGSERKAACIDARQTCRMRAGVGRIDVAAEMERVGLARPDQRRNGVPAGEECEQTGSASEEAAA